jgi:integrase
MTVQEWAKLWTENYDRKDCKANTVQAHGYIFKNHILPAIGEIELSELTGAEIEEFIESKDLNDQTLRNITNLLRKCLQQAMDNELIAENPSRGFFYTGSRSIQANIMSPKEMEDYLSAAKQLKKEAIFQLMLSTGIMVGELVNLKWSDLTLRRRKLTIHGQHLRTILLTMETIELLKREHAKHPSSESLFIHPGSCKAYTRGEIYRIHRRVLKRSGMEGIRLLDLRHTYAVNAL